MSHTPLLFLCGLLLSLPPLPSTDATPSTTGLCFSCVDGRTAYEQVEANFGAGSVESPDYSTKTRCPKTNGTRIQCVSTPTWPSKIFKFELILDQDCEPVADVAGRQRNEIKVYDKSNDFLKGLRGTTMRYSWKFRLNSSMLVSRKFTHLFQLKFVGGDSQKPAATFTGAQQSGVSTFQVRNTSVSNMKENKLAVVPWSSVTGKWLQAVVDATLLPIDGGGRLKVNISRLDDGQQVILLDEAAGLWRPGNEFLRPKWGIYRQSNHSNIAPGDLNDAMVFFTDFCVENVTAAATTDDHHGSSTASPSSSSTTTAAAAATTNSSETSAAAGGVHGSSTASPSSSSTTAAAAAATTNSSETSAAAGGVVFSGVATVSAGVLLAAAYVLLSVEGS